MKTPQVAQFHRKVVRRLAAEKRSADACARGGRIIYGRIGSIDTFANVLESSGFTLEEEKGMLWEEHALPSEEVCDKRKTDPLLPFHSRNSWASVRCYEIAASIGTLLKSQRRAELVFRLKKRF